MTEPPRLASIRRVDWRFLLPEGAFTTVAVVGTADEPVLDGLGQVAGTVIRVDGEGPDDGAKADLVVTIAASRTVLDRALRRVPPGGLIYAGAGPRRAAGRSSFREVTGALRSAGFVDVHRSWHWPSEPAALEIVPIDDAGAVRLALDRRRSGRIARVKAAMAGVALRLHVLDRIVPGWSVIGRRPWADGEPAVANALDPVRASLPDRRGAEASFVLLTPRFRASRHVVGLVLRPAGDGLAAVVKLARLSEDDGGIRREAEALRRAGELGGSGVPEVLAFRGAPDSVLVESALDGVVITGQEVRAKPVAAIDEVEAWTRALAGEPTGPQIPLRAFWAPAVERIEGQLGPRTPLEVAPIARLTELTARILGRLDHVAIPAVVEHGDLAPPNLLRLRDGQLGVVDWEVADLQGLPLGDLLFFAAFLVSEPSDKNAVADPPAVRAALERQATHLDIDPGLIPALQLVMWARWADRQSGRFVDRGIPLEDRLPARHLRSWSAAMADLAFSD